MVTIKTWLGLGAYCGYRWCFLKQCGLAVGNGKLGAMSRVKITY